jgi:lipopolysaccharide export LptBFGC system permease protein LptF
MDHVEAERLYASLKAQWNAGQITQEQFISGVNNLRYQDFNGVWWAINGDDGSWLKWNGTVWEATSVSSTIPADSKNKPAFADTTSPGISLSSFPLQQAKPERNWIGIGSIACSLLALLAFPYALALFAIILGAFSLYRSRKMNGTIAYTALVGILIAVFVIILNYYYIALVAPHELPPAEFTPSLIM